MSEYTVEEGMKAEKYQELLEEFENDEISEDELERRMDRLFESGDDFLDEDPNATPSISEKSISALSTLRPIMSYYALPICALLPFIVIVLMPGISPMVAVTSAPLVLSIGLGLFIMYKMVS